MKKHYYLHILWNTQRVAVCCGTLTLDEVRTVRKLALMIGDEGDGWLLNDHGDEVALVEDISGPDNPYAVPEATPIAILDWWQPGIGRAMADCTLADFCFWLGMHYERLRVGDVRYTKHGDVEWKYREEMVPETATTPEALGNNGTQPDGASPTGAE